MLEQVVMVLGLALSGILLALFLLAGLFFILATFTGSEVNDK